MSFSLKCLKNTLVLLTFSRSPARQCVTNLYCSSSNFSNKPHMFRSMKDSLGVVEVPADRYYGPQTERSRRNFQICVERDRMPIKVVYALAMLKKVAAGINMMRSRVTESQAAMIQKACEEVYTGKCDDHFPLCTWQTGSGTQTNMNVNEVVAFRASELLTGAPTDQPIIHPNDHVNCGQSSNDIFPTAMNVCVAIETSRHVLPALESLKAALENKAGEFKNVVKIGRTHMQDAVPMTVGQELSAFVAQLDQAIGSIKKQLELVCELAIGGTAVGTGLNSVQGFDEEMCVGVSDLIRTLYPMTSDDKVSTVDLQFTPAENKFAALAGHDALLELSGAFNCTATALIRLASDFTILSSGPNCGFGELLLPPNEPGSSIMPGKVNPTQCEALSMVSIQVMGNHFTVTMAAASGRLQLNVHKPLILMNMLHSCQLLSDVAHSFRRNCVEGLQVNTERVQEHLRNSLMLVTALAPRIGYDEAARVAKYAQQNKMTLCDAVVQLNLMSAGEYDQWVRPDQMACPFPNK